MNALMSSFEDSVMNKTTMNGQKQRLASTRRLGMSTMFRFVVGGFLVPILGSGQTGPTQPSTATPLAPFALLNNTPYIAPGDLPGPLAVSHQQTGLRMIDATSAQVMLIGKITDVNGTRNAQITLQAPGLLAYRELGRAVVFDGTTLKTAAGLLNSNDDTVAQSLLAHFPDAIFLQVATGGGWRRIGAHFRTENSTSAGPFYTVVAFSPAKRNGLSVGKALQQELFILIDETTDLIAEVRTALHPGQPNGGIAQTVFTGWQKQVGQWFPGTIQRLENGKQVFSFSVQQASVRPADAVESFKP